MDFVVLVLLRSIGSRSVGGLFVGHIVHRVAGRLHFTLSDSRLQIPSCVRSYSRDKIPVNRGRTSASVPVGGSTHEEALDRDRDRYVHVGLTLATIGLVQFVRVADPWRRLRGRPRAVRGISSTRQHRLRYYGLKDGLAGMEKTEVTLSLRSGMNSICRTLAEACG